MYYVDVWPGRKLAHFVWINTETSTIFSSNSKEVLKCKFFDLQRGPLSVKTDGLAWILNVIILVVDNWVNTYVFKLNLA